MPGDLNRILSLEVPIIVRLGQRSMTVGEVLSMIPGTIIELPKAADEELDLLVNNKVVGSGTAVKVGENFGIKVSFTGDMKSRIAALAAAAERGAPPPEGEVSAIASQLLAGRA